MIGFHNHTQLTPTTYDGEILTHGKYLGINLDIGHYVAGTQGKSPIPVLASEWGVGRWIADLEIRHEGGKFLLPEAVD